MPGPWAFQAELFAWPLIFRRPEAFARVRCNGKTPLCQLQLKTARPDMPAPDRPGTAGGLVSQRGSTGFAARSAGQKSPCAANDAGLQGTEECSNGQAG